MIAIWFANSFLIWASLSGIRKALYFRYLENASRMLLVMVYGNNDHYCTNSKKAEEPVMACS